MNMQLYLWNWLLYKKTYLKLEKYHTRLTDTLCHETDENNFIFLH